MFENHILTVYNEAVTRARNIRVELQQRSNEFDQSYSNVMLAELISLLQKLSFLITCPALAEHGADEVRRDPELVERAARNPTSAMMQLMHELRAIQRAGNRRIVVAGVHVSLLKVASEFLAYEAPDLGEHFHFNGSLSRKQKDDSKQSFLTCNVGLLFLSIGCGGQGLHLVPGTQSMVLFGAAPWSAAECDQLFKRIHRIGQPKPVSVTYMVAYGSVDASIYSIHGCKRRLEKLTVDTWKSATDLRSTRIDKRGKRRLSVANATRTTSSKTTKTSYTAPAPAWGKKPVKQDQQAAFTMSRKYRKESYARFDYKG